MGCGASSQPPPPPPPEPQPPPPPLSQVPSDLFLKRRPSDRPLFNLMVPRVSMSETALKAIFQEIPSVQESMLRKDSLSASTNSMLSDLSTSPPGAPPASSARGGGSTPSSLGLLPVALSSEALVTSTQPTSRRGSKSVSLGLLPVGSGGGQGELSVPQPLSPSARRGSSQRMSLTAISELLDPVAAGAGSSSKLKKKHLSAPAILDEDIEHTDHKVS